MANDVMFLKLITGEEVIARVKQDGDTLILDSPMIFKAVTQNDAQTQARIQELLLFPWIFSANNKKVELSLSHVIVKGDANESHAKEYLSIVTGLTL